MRRITIDRFVLRVFASVGVATVLLMVVTACGDDSNERSRGPDLGGTPTKPSSLELQTFVSSASRINTLVERPDDPHLYVVEQNGLVLRIERPTIDDPDRARISSTEDLFAHDVLDIRSITESDGEEGLVGLAFDPSGTRAYVNHSRAGDGHSVIAEYQVDDDGRFVAATRRELFVIEQSSNAHNAGQLLFGPDGHLYLGVGDGSGFADTERRALDLSSPLGKILRINPLGTETASYSVPDDNPFADVDAADPRVWSYGLRNPFSFSFDEATGDLWIADVGQGAVEEINVAPARRGANAGRGLNFGWSAYEGELRFNRDQSAEDHVEPYLTYLHEQGRCAVVDGVLLRDSVLTGLDGWYLFGDWCSGEIWAHQPGGDDRSFVTVASVMGPTQVLQTSDGNVYVSSHFGSVAMLVST